MKHYLPLIALIFLNACKGQSETEDQGKPVGLDSVITVNMTFDRDIDVNVQKISVVPNNVAPWAGSLFIIDDQNILYRSNIESGDFKSMSKDIKTMAPLSRKNKAGILLTLTPEDQMSGLYEINDQGDYVEIDLSSTPDNITNFCAVNTLSEQRVYGRQNEGQVSALDIVSPIENSFINSAYIEKLNTQHDEACALSINDKDVSPIKLPPNALDVGVIGTNQLLFTTAESRIKPRLYLKDDERIIAIDITGGLSSEAPKRIDSLYVSQSSLGGALRDGAVILADNESKRLIYISLSFLELRAGEIAPPQDSTLH